MAPSKDSKGAKKRPSSNRVRLETDAFKVDADALQLSDFYAKLIMDPRFRKKFEANPVRALKAAGFSITDEVAAQMTPDLIQQRLDGLIEGADSQQMNVAVGVRVGVASRVATNPSTNPATNPGVSVGVSVMTSTQTVPGPTGPDPGPDDPEDPEDPRDPDDDDDDDDDEDGDPRDPDEPGDPGDPEEPETPDGGGGGRPGL
ncbi:MAG: hypothetical protein ABJ388_09450 [Alphaproteobacteria bacterium]|tara:strand:- start:1581 stop:2186 length:606 start_codon:yes stop_codon:yes gene_type:complete